MISHDDYFRGRDKQYAADLTPEIEANAVHTIACANLALTLFYKDTPTAAHPVVNSGWRPPAVNQATAGAAPHSRHMLAMAIDLSDHDRKLCLWSLRNKDRLKQCGILGMERPEATPDWCHWQTEAVGSGVFVFWPTQAALVAWQKSGDPLMVG